MPKCYECAIQSTRACYKCRSMDMFVSKNVDVIEQVCDKHKLLSKPYQDNCTYELKLPKEKYRDAKTVTANIYRVYGKSNKYSVIKIRGYGYEYDEVVRVANIITKRLNEGTISKSEFGSRLIISLSQIFNEGII